MVAVWCPAEDLVHRVVSAAGKGGNISLYEYGD